MFALLVFGAGWVNVSEQGLARCALLRGLAFPVERNTAHGRCKGGAPDLCRVIVLAPGLNASQQRANAGEAPPLQR